MSVFKLLLKPEESQRRSLTCSLNALRLKNALHDSHDTASKLHPSALSPHTAHNSSAFLPPPNPAPHPPSSEFLWRHRPLFILPELWGGVADSTPDGVRERSEVSSSREISLYKGEKCSGGEVAGSGWGEVSWIKNRSLRPGFSIANLLVIQDLVANKAWI